MFNLEQVQELEKVFAKQHSLVGKKRAQLAARLNLTENQVGAEARGPWAASGDSGSLCVRGVEDMDLLPLCQIFTEDTPYLFAHSLRKERRCI